jgi:hypothetical protein
LKRAKARVFKGAKRREKSAVFSEKRARAVRDEIKSVIVESALDMTKSVIRAVNKRGSVAAMSFLWSLADMSSGTVGGKAKKNALSMTSLTRRLGLVGGSDEKTPASDVSSKVESH